MTDIKQKAREVAEWFARKYMTPKRSPTYCIEDMAKKVAAAIQSAVDEEREACTKIPRRISPSAGACINEIENAIRARSQKVLDNNTKVR